jgi:uncharacterized protein
MPIRRSFPVIDADGHVLERDRDLREFLPPRFRAVKGKREYPLFSWDGWARGALSPQQREHPSVELWLRFLKATDIKLTVLYPNEGLNIGLQRDRDWAVALARAYNEWLHHEFLSASPCFQGVALLAPQDPTAAAEELARAVENLGMIAGMLPGVMTPMRGLGLPEFDPIYRTAESFDVPLAVHSGPAVELGLDHVQSFAGVYPLSHPFAQMQQLTSMMIYGVFERFPRLRMAFLESGCGWVPYLADRLDESWQHRRDRWPYPTQRSPSEIMRAGNLFYACEREESTLPTVAKLIGGGQLLWASDFPHERPWHEFSGDIDTLINRTDLPESLPRQILFENPCRFYKFSPELIRTQANTTNGL